MNITKSEVLTGLMGAVLGFALASGMDAALIAASEALADSAHKAIVTAQGVKGECTPEAAARWWVDGKDLETARAKLCGKKEK